MRDRIGIALVRPALLGTYGDAGNAAVLLARLRWRGIPAELIVVDAPHAVPRFCDVIVLGGGEDDAQAAVAEDQGLRDSVAIAVESGAATLAVCGGFQLLGRGIESGAGQTIRGFDLFDWHTERLRSRAVGEITCDSLLADAPGRLTGFENHGGRTVLGPGVSALGAVRSGVGNGWGSVEGAATGRTIGTYLHGPVLARNPQLADHLLAMVVGDLEPIPDGPIDTLRSERLRAPVADIGRAAVRRLRARGARRLPRPR